jgi:hypothetical protein
LDQVQWGVLAVEGASGRVVYAHRPTTKLIPASNMKLPVAAAALHLLGPDHRFVTELRGAGRLDAASGVLDGDLVLPAAGDPTLSTRFRGSPTAALEALADVMNLHKGRIMLVFPSGAKVNDKSGLLEGDYKDGRRIAIFKDLDDVKEKQKPLQKIIKDWLKLVDK